MRLILDIFLWSSLGASIALVLAAELRYRNWKLERAARLRAIGMPSAIRPQGMVTAAPSESRIHRVTDLTTGLSIDAENFILPDILTVMESHRQWLTEEITDSMAQARHEGRVSRRYTTIPQWIREWEVAG